MSGRKTVVINAVGLTPALLDRHKPPALGALARQTGVRTIAPVLPAVTCTVQSTYLTGRLPKDHGIVANGWYFRDECEVKFWRQSNALVQGRKIWHDARSLDPTFTCANLFWWYNMYSDVDVSVTPRPMYPADGRKLPDLHTHPDHVRVWLQAELGQFPLFRFWGPATTIESTRWIAEAAVLVDRRFDPTLSLIYLPHLDYSLQRRGPDDPANAVDVRELDDVVARLVSHYRGRGARVVVLSEYGIGAVSRPVHINRALRQGGWITVRDELGRELLDAGASDAFAVADHQLAHVYVKDRRRVEDVARLLRSVSGIAEVLDDAGKRRVGLEHERSGELVCLAEHDAWFTYYHWLDDELAPDFARTVDIHRKPGYDPVELLIDPALRAPKLKIAWRLLQRKLGMRALLDVIGLDANVVRGSHGIAPRRPDDGAILLADAPGDDAAINPCDIAELIIKTVYPDSAAR